MITEKKTSTERIRWIPFIASLVMIFFGPFAFYQGPFYIAQRFAVFPLPAVLFALRAPDSPRAAADRRSALLIFLSTVVLAGVLTHRFIVFNRDARDFDAVLEVMAPNKRVMGYDRLFYPQSGLSVPFLHFAAYYQIAKGGIFENSFANNPQQIASYKPDNGLSPIKYPHQWEKTSMAWGYDYYLVRSDENEANRLNPAAKLNMHLVTVRGPWWLFEANSRN